jgi:hypothetical protein
VLEGVVAGAFQRVGADGELEFDAGRIEVLDGRCDQVTPRRAAAPASLNGCRTDVERKTRFELATLALARRCSTTELLPHDNVGAQRLEL